MDSKPFLEFNITDMKDSQIEELKKFHKSYFNVENIVNSASELKYLIQLKHLLHSELNNPSADFVNHFTKQVYQGRVTAKISEQFTALTKLAINQHISDIITERLKTALKQEDESLQINNNAVEIKPEDTNKINTTDEEKEAFMIIKSILRQKIDSKRIIYRDAQSYFAVLLDDNNRKTICRLYLGENKKYIAIIDSDKKEIKTEINSLDEIFNFGNSLIEKVIFYDSSKELN